MKYTKKFPHYYGDIVRALFLVAALIMLIELPALNRQIGVPVAVSVVSILVLGLAAGLTNPELIWDAGINMAISVLSFGVFETYAVIAFRENGGTDTFFLTNLALGFVCLLAVYFSVKTLRGLMMGQRGHDTDSNPK